MEAKKYLERINYSGGLSISPALLARLQEAHLLSVPFENLDIHYQKPILLDVGSLYEKIVLQRRGGFCYELNGLFHALLCQLGFDATIISARVHISEGSYSPEYDHMAILVYIDGTHYLCDVGFGEFAFMPLKLECEQVQHDSRGDFIVEEHEKDNFRVSKMEEGEKRPEYIFNTAKKQLQEFEERCLYHQLNPASHFKQRKMISRPTPNGRITLTGNFLKITEDGHLAKEEVIDEACFEEKLLAIFGIKINAPE